MIQNLFKGPAERERTREVYRFYSNERIKVFMRPKIVTATPVLITALSQFDYDMLFTVIGFIRVKKEQKLLPLALLIGSGC